MRERIERKYRKKNILFERAWMYARRCMSKNGKNQPEMNIGVIKMHTGCWSILYFFSSKFMLHAALSHSHIVLDSIKSFLNDICTVFLVPLSASISFHFSWVRFLFVSVNSVLMHFFTKKTYFMAFDRREKKSDCIQFRVLRLSFFFIFFYFLVVFIRTQNDNRK